MNPFKNIFKHPRTSAAGVLISVATVSGVLAQQGVTFGSVGGGTVVSLAGALATALLGLMARDPGALAAQSEPAAEPAQVTDCSGNCSGTCSGQSSSTAKLNAWLLIALLLPLPWLQGCNAHDVATDIVNWTPSLQSAIATVDSTAVLLAPDDAPVFAAATAGFDAAANLLITQARAYLVNPAANTLTQLQNQIVTFQQQINSALLKTARIIDTASQQHAMIAIQAVATIITAILALVQSISSKAEVAQMAAQSQIKLAAVSPYLGDSRSAELIAAHYNEPMTVARLQIAQSTQSAMNAGF
jgi:hypothetical protein